MNTALIDIWIDRISDWMRNVRQSFRAKLMVLLIAAVTVPTIITGIYLGSRLTRQINEAVNQQLQSELATLQLMVTNEWEGVQSSVLRLSNDNTLQKNLDLSLYSYLQRYVNEQRSVTTLDWILIHQTGDQRLVSGTIDSAVTSNIIDNKKFFIDSLQNTPHLYATVPVISNGDTLGLISGGKQLRSSQTSIWSMFSKNRDIPVLWYHQKAIALDTTGFDVQHTLPDSLNIRYEVEMAGRNFVGMSDVLNLESVPVQLSILRPVDTYHQVLWYSILTIVLSIVLITGLFLMGGMRIVDHIAEPLNKLTHYTRSLISDSFNPASKDEIQKLARYSGDEVGELASAFQSMQSQLDTYIKDLKEATERQERMNSELRIARDIQMNMLPGRDEISDLDKFFDVTTSVIPARQVGGDFYDLFEISDRYYAVIIGDVADKGVPAALFMAMCKTLIRALTMLEFQRGSDDMKADRILNQVNRELHRDNDMFMFVTLFLGIVDIRESTLMYATAGHLPPILVKENRQPVMLAQHHAAPLGVSEQPGYQSQSIEITEGDTLLLYTDGITEAENDYEEFFGEQRLITVMRQDYDKVEEAARQILRSVKQFEGGREQTDDKTLVVLRVKIPYAQKQPDDHAVKGESETITVTNNTNEIPALSNCIHRFCKQQKLDDEVENDLMLIIEEYFTNLTKYSFSDEQSHTIQVLLNKDAQAVQIEITDDGKPYDVSAVSMKQLKKCSAEKKPGKHGVLIIRSLADRISYHRNEDQNRCVIRYNLKSETKS